MLRLGYKNQGGKEREFYDPDPHLSRKIVNFSFPIKFNNHPLAVQMQSIQSAESYRTTFGTVIFNTITSNGFKAYHSELTPEVQAAKLGYIAIGI